MQIGVLSDNHKLFSTERLKQAAKERGHKVRALKTSDISIFIQKGSPALSLNGKILGKCDAVIPRIAGSIGWRGTAIVRQFEQLGVFSLNSSHSIERAHDKLRTLQILSRHKVRIPCTSLLSKSKDIDPALDVVGDAPVVLKLLRGSQGTGVVLAETRRSAQAMAQALLATGQSVLMQKFISEAIGRDIRAFVVGGRVVAAMRRIAEEGEFRSNCHLGGRTEAVTLSEEYKQAAVLAARAMGLRVAGVDLLESDQGPLVMEVNSSPGLEGIESSTGVDVAGAMIEYLEEQVLFPEVDMHERLSIGMGYAVVEIPVKKKSEMAGRSIIDLAFSKREIQVLSISRQGLQMPCPAADEIILAGDRLLCFGKQLTLNALMPAKRKRVNKVIAKVAENEEVSTTD